MSSVTYGSIPYVDKPVSQIFYGTAIQPYLTGQDANELLDAIYAAGITAFDCARNYMAAELSLGKWIDARGNRDKIVLLTKCGHPSMFGKKRINEKEIRKDFAKSSKYLHTDYFDIYLLHRDDPDVEAGTIVEIFNALHAEGKIGAFGGSNWMHQRIEQANEYAYAHNLIPFSVSSPNFGLADQINDPWGHGCVTISGPSQTEARRWYEQNGMPVIAYSSLGRGLFSGKLKSADTDKAASILDGTAMKGYGYPENYERLRRCELLAEKKGASVPQIAMAWIYNQKINSFAVVSTTRAKRMRENIDALHIKLSLEELAFLDLEREELS